MQSCVIYFQGKKDGQQTLERLEANNLFVVPLDDEQQWYRYHHLFGELLVFRLQRHYLAEVSAKLHYRAGQWYEAAGLWDEAVYHIVMRPYLCTLTIKIC